MSYDKDPPWRDRFSFDAVLPAVAQPVIWPNISWFLSPPEGGGRESTVAECGSDSPPTQNADETL